MARLDPIYMPSNCNPAFQLNWSLTVFWRAQHPGDYWLTPLRNETQKDGVRVLEHRYASQDISQFLLSTRPSVSPSAAVRSVKGRLAHVLRDIRPKALRRNFAMRAVGSATREVIDRYVAGQIGHHLHGDPGLKSVLEEHQVHAHDVDLSAPEGTSHALYWYNLHIVLVRGGRWRDARRAELERVRETVLAVARKHQHRIARASILPTICI